MPFQIIRNDITKAEGADKMFLFANINKKLEEYRTTPGAVLVDVREVDEFRSGHIPGAINQPLSNISQIKIPKDKILFVYCLRGSRSRRAVGILKSNWRILVFLNMSRQGPALVSSVAVHKGSSIYLFKGRQPLFLFILPICGPGQISVLWILIGGDWVVIGDWCGHGG